MVAEVSHFGAAHMEFGKAAQVPEVVDGAVGAWGACHVQDLPPQAVDGVWERFRLRRR